MVNEGSRISRDLAQLESNLKQGFQRLNGDHGAVATAPQQLQCENLHLYYEWLTTKRHRIDGIMSLLEKMEEEYLPRLHFYLLSAKTDKAAGKYFWTIHRFAERLKPEEEGSAPRLKNIVSTKNGDGAGADDGKPRRPKRCLTMPAKLRNRSICVEETCELPAAKHTACASLSESNPPSPGANCRRKSALAVLEVMHGIDAGGVTVAAGQQGTTAPSLEQFARSPSAPSGLVCRPDAAQVSSAASRAIVSPSIGVPNGTSSLTVPHDDLEGLDAEALEDME